MTHHSGPDANSQSDVADDGTVVFWAYPYSVFRFKAGTLTRLTHDDPSVIWNLPARTDGERVVYRKLTPCCLNQVYAIALLEGGRETILRPYSASEPYPNVDYDVKAGVVAFTRPGTLGQQHVFLRYPGGETKQVTFFGTSSRIETLARSGSVSVINGGRRYISAGSEALEPVSSALGTSFFVQGRWLVAIGKSLFAVQTAATSAERGSLPEGAVALDPLYPNPSRSSTTGAFGVREGGAATLALYDVMGRRVRTVYEGTLPAMHHQTFTVRLDDLASGLYLMRLESGGEVATRTLTVAK